jgi:hypothetical protein
MTIIHDRSVGFQNFGRDPTEAPNPQINLKISEPGPGYVLVRSRLFLELRIAAYSLSDSDQPDQFWWSGIFPVVGLWYNAASAVPGFSDSPISGYLNNQWIMWDGLSGDVDNVTVSPNGHQRWVYKWRYLNTTMDSHAQRTPHGEATQSVWLSWELMDPAGLIDRSHLSFDVVFDLQAEWAADLFWKPLPS